jgi:hypothetical protein
MARRVIGTKRSRDRGRGLSSAAKGVMRAYRRAKAAAPDFVSSCGVFPEVSESASAGLHEIVNDVATRGLSKRRLMSRLQKEIARLPAAKTRAASSELLDRISNDLTALLACEATAGYLFGLSVGMTVRSLPERIARS